jgi:hypothetical protein
MERKIVNIDDFVLTVISNVYMTTLTEEIVLVIIDTGDVNMYDIPNRLIDYDLLEMYDRIMFDSNDKQEQYSVIDRVNAMIKTWKDQGFTSYGAYGKRFKGTTVYIAL